MLVTHSFTRVQIAPKWKHLIIIISMTDQRNCRLFSYSNVCYMFL